MCLQVKNNGIYFLTASGIAGRKKGLLVYAWCLMSNHVHLVVGARHKDTSDILRDFKKFTSKQIIRAIAENQKESRRDWMLEIFRKAGTPK